MIFSHLEVFFQADTWVNITLLTLDDVRASPFQVYSSVNVYSMLMQTSVWQRRNPFCLITFKLFFFLGNAHNASSVLHQWLAISGARKEVSCFLVGHTVTLPSTVASLPAWGANSELDQASNYQLDVAIFCPGRPYNNNEKNWQDSFSLVLRPVC